MWIKNADTQDQTWVGQLISAGQYYQVQSSERISWANNSKLLTDIGSGLAIVAKDNSGNNDITDVSQAINYLKELLPIEVTTQFEKPDKLLKLASGCAAVDSQTGEALFSLQVPGTFNGVDPENSNGRFIESGEAWFDVHHQGDKICSIEIVDDDNILGYGAGTVIKTYHDDEVAANNQGWIANTNSPSVKVEALGGYGFLPAELYVKIKGKKSVGNYSGEMCVNLKWGTSE